MLLQRTEPKTLGFLANRMFSVILDVMDEGSDVAHERPSERLEASQSDDALTQGFIRILTRPPQWEVCSSMTGPKLVIMGCTSRHPVHTEPSLSGIKAQTF
jgi:hypothetical protein